MKVHIWAGISMHGRTGICIFEGIMDAPVYVSILEQTLIPFVPQVFPHPDKHRFMQVNFH